MMRTEELTIAGMTCGHCIMSVKKELALLPGVSVDDVQIGRATVRFDDTKTTRDELSSAIGRAGYELVAP